jgi:hypothetical protein
VECRITEGLGLVRAGEGEEEMTGEGDSAEVEFGGTETVGTGLGEEEE